MGLRGPPSQDAIMQPPAHTHFADMQPPPSSRVDYPDIDPLDDLRLSGKSRREKLLAIREMLLHEQRAIHEEEHRFRSEPLLRDPLLDPYADPRDRSFPPRDHFPDPYALDPERRDYDNFGRRPMYDEPDRRAPFDELDRRPPLLDRPPREHLLDDPYRRPGPDPYGYPPRGETTTLLVFG